MRVELEEVSGGFRATLVVSWNRLLRLLWQSLVAVTLMSAMLTSSIGQTALTSIHTFLYWLLGLVGT
jgi:hypothetical protein